MKLPVLLIYVNKKYIVKKVSLYSQLRIKPSYRYLIILKVSLQIEISHTLSIIMFISYKCPWQGTDSRSRGQHLFRKSQVTAYVLFMCHKLPRQKLVPSILST
jgi:hypothetical protein